MIDVVGRHDGGLAIGPFNIVWSLLQGPHQWGRTQADIGRDAKRQGPQLRVFQLVHLPRARAMAGQRHHCVLSGAYRRGGAR